MDRLRLAVIADDLTGGADTGVQFCPRLGPVYLTSGVGGAAGIDASASRAAALYTNSRHLSPQEAAERVCRAYDRVRHLSPGCIYKKIDSCMRGNVGAEIEALLLRLGAALSFVAPALPGQGRATVSDIHMIDGIPMAQTEMAKDPLSPVRESRLSVLLAGQCRLQVGRVDLDIVAKGGPALAAAVREQGARGCRHIVFDAAEKKHLDNIVKAARAQFDVGEILFAGSAGLAASLAGEMDDEAPPESSLRRPRIGRWLFVCGSASAAMARQLELLLGHSSWRQVSVSTERQPAGPGAATGGNVCSGSLAQPPGQGLVIALAAPAERGSATAPAEVILQRLAEAAGQAAAQNPPEGLFLSGGDTAEAVLERIGASGVVLEEEILPGLMRGVISGGSCHDLPVVTKAGSFGADDCLVELTQLLH